MIIIIKIKKSHFNFLPLCSIAIFIWFYFILYKYYINIYFCFHFIFLSSKGVLLILQGLLKIL
uniref:Uncharacterized protein n=1 Tax=Anguilla anguilla TaxID=7936 RepID=A0A0E9WP77_ANGAN